MHSSSKTCQNALKFIDPTRFKHNRSAYLAASAEAFEEAIRLKPNQLESQYNLASILDDLGEYRRAIRVLDKLITWQPDFAAAYMNRGVMYHRLGEQNKSKKDFKRALRLTDNSARGLLCQATAQFNLGRTKACQKLVNHAIKQYPAAQSVFQPILQTLEGLSPSQAFVLPLPSLSTLRKLSHLDELVALRQKVRDEATLLCQRLDKAAPVGLAGAIVLGGLLAYNANEPIPVNLSNVVHPGQGSVEISFSPLQLQDINSSSHRLDNAQGFVSDDSPTRYHPFAGRLMEASVIGQNPRGWDPSTYDMEIGSVMIDFSSDASLTYNDNVNLSEMNEKEDFIASAGLNVEARWPITELNTLSLSLDAGYSKYLDNPDLDSSFITIQPDSMLSLDVVVKDFTFTLYDNFSYTEDPYETSTVTNVGKFKRATNRVGVDVKWDGGDLDATAGYNHFNYWSVDQAQFDDLDRVRDTIKSSVTAQYTEQLKLGLWSEYTWTDFKTNVRPDGEQWQIGPSLDFTFNDKLNLESKASYHQHGFDRGGSTDGFNFMVLLRHELSDNIQHSLSLSRNFSVGTNANTLSLNRIGYISAWQVNDFTTVNSNLFWEDGEESDNTFSEDFERYGFTAGVNYLLNPQTNIGVNLGISERDSEQIGKDYTRHTLGVSLSYDF